MFLVFQGNHGLWCTKPAVKQDIPGSDACTLGRMDQLHHDICSFAACLQASPSGKGASVTGLPSTKEVLVLRGRKEAVADRHKGVPVRPAKGEHPESTAVFHGAVVKDPCRQFHLFRAGAVKQAVVNNEDILALFVRQGFHESVDDAGRKQCCETLPVRPGVVKEAVNGVFGESLPKCECEIKGEKKVLVTLNPATLVLNDKIDAKNNHDCQYVFTNNDKEFWEMDI